MGYCLHVDLRAATCPPVRLSFGIGSGRPAHLPYPNVHKIILLGQEKILF